MPETKNNNALQGDGTEWRNALLRAVFTQGALGVCEYRAADDTLVIYNEDLTISQEIGHYIENIMDDSRFHPDDRWAAREFFLRKTGDEALLRAGLGDRFISILVQMMPVPGVDPAERLTLVMRDVTKEKLREAILEERVKRDSMTGLYNSFFGRELINEYLSKKTPLSAAA